MWRVPIGGIFGGLVLFGWGYFSWTVLTWHEIPRRQVDNEEAFMKVLSIHVDETGWYVFPQMFMRQLAKEPDERKREEMVSRWIERHKSGPIVQIFCRVEGTDPMSWQVLAKGMAAAVVAGIAAAWLLYLSLPAVPDYTTRVLMVVLAGVMLIFMTDVSYWVFMFTPDDYAVLMCLDHLVGSVLLGLTTALVVRPPRQRSS